MKKQNQGLTGEGLNVFESQAGEIREVVIRITPTDQTMSRKEQVEFMGKHLAKVINESIQDHIDGVFTIRAYIGFKGDEVWMDDVSLKKSIVQN